MRFSNLAAIAAALFFSSAAVSQSIEEDARIWPASPRDFTSTEQVISVANAFPNSAGMQRRRLGAAMQAGDSAAVLDALRRLATLGAVLTAAAQAQVAERVGAEAMAPISARMAANAAMVAGSRAFASIPVDHPLIEGVIWDSRARRLYATSVVGRRLVRLDRGHASAVDAGALGSLLGGAYDPATRRIWVASAEIETTPRDRANFAGLASIDPANPADVRRIPAPAAAVVAPGDVAVAADGTVYVSDGLSGAIYLCRPGCATLELAFPAGVLFSAQGLALSPDQRLLYIADRRYGLAAFERATGRLLRVSAPDDVMLDGMDGLLAYDGDLIATQTAYPPVRIVRLRMAADGLGVTGLEVLERANSAWGEVTLMALAADRLIYVAGAQWNHYGAGGAPNAESPPGPTAIRSLRLRRNRR